MSGVSNTVVGMIQAGDGSAIGINTATNRVYVARPLSNEVQVIDGNTNFLLGAVPVGGNPQGVDVNPLTNSIYVANFDDGTVSVIDGISSTVIATVAVGTGPISVGINP